MCVCALILGYPKSSSVSTLCQTDKIMIGINFYINPFDFYVHNYYDWSCYLEIIMLYFNI